MNQQNALLILMFYAIFLLFYMFQTSYVHHQDAYIVHTVLYGMFFMHLYTLMLNRAKHIYQYKNMKKKIYRTNSAMWYKKTRRQKKKYIQLTPDYISVKINGNNLHCLNTIKAVTQYRLNKTAYINAWKTYHIRLYVQYILRDHENKMSETRRRQAELN